jgi:hypothetical protein
MFAFISEESPGNEGVMAFKAPNGLWWPMVGADMARVEQLRPIADKIALATDTPYEVRHFKLSGVLPPPEES